MFPPITPVVKNLLIINGLIFVAQLTFQNKFPVDEWFAQHHFMSKEFKPHQLITAMFMHADFSHLFGNMLSLYLFGSKLEMVWGSKRFLQFYLICGIGAGLIIGLSTWVETYGMLHDINVAISNTTPGSFNPIYTKLGNSADDKIQELYPSLRDLYVNWQSDPGNAQYVNEIQQFLAQLKTYYSSSSVLGASGAIFGLIIGAAYLFPNDIIFIDLFIPLRIKWLALIYTGLEIYAAIQNDPRDQVAHMAHLGGALVGFLIVHFVYRKNRRNFY